MAKVSLRIYNREIERLIEQGHTDEAIAHCRHILQTFPKHLETYRLLGKSYLESKRYNEAVDIFGRVLMAVPNDFVAHVGLSIIRDEENKLDDAIWHMERAFEAQPSNAAIQGELQRLYGRRDGMEPPKIRMTRGALAHMYVQGELYPQAVAEIRQVLSQDPQRSDMQVLLAYSHFKSGQKSDASDICNQLLGRYPYCFDANRIMADLLSTTSDKSESMQVYRMRVGELDPYANFTKGSIFQTNEVSDASINLDRLEYSGSEVSMAQEWGSSLGIELGASAPALGAASLDEQPDWLKAGGSKDETPQAAPEPGSASEAGGEIPDFLRAAGWGESNTPEQATSIFDEEPAGKLVPADLPNWLKGQSPVSATPDRLEEPAVDMLQSTETPDWLEGLGGAVFSESPPEEGSTPTGDAPDWLSGLGGAVFSESPQEGSAPASDAPDWLSGLGAAAFSETPQESSPPAGDAPAWLRGLGGSKSSDGQAQPAEVPDWLSDAEPKSEPSPIVESFGAPAQEQEDVVTWLESLAEKHGVDPEELLTDPTNRNESAPEELVQTQNGGGQAPAQPNLQNLGSSAQEQDDAVAWLESLAAKHGAKPEELVTDPNKRSDTPPEWVQQAQAIGETQPAPVEESAKPDSDWVENAQNIGEQSFSEFETPATPPAASDDTGMWLRDLGEKEQQEQPVEEKYPQRGTVPEWLSDAQQPAPSAGQTEASGQKPAARSSDLPSWLSGIEGEATPPEASFESQTLGGQDLSDWLSGLDDEPGLEFDPEIIRASARPPFPDSSHRADEKTVEDKPAQSEMPDWSSKPGSGKQGGLDEEAWKKSSEEKFISPAPTPTEEPVSHPQGPPVTLAVDLPDWLQGVDEESSQTYQAKDDDTPPWLHREQWESEAEETPQQPMPTSPSDWHPLEEKPEPVPPASVEKPPSVPSQVRAQPMIQNPPQPKPGESLVVPPIKKKKPGISRSSRTEGQGYVNALNQAKGELDRGDIPAALDHYGKLIKKGRHLEETISDLAESIYRYPVEVGIWQTLGDAYMRSNRLKEALEAYNKAEELIR